MNFRDSDSSDDELHIESVQVSSVQKSYKGYSDLKSSDSSLSQQIKNKRLLLNQELYHIDGILDQATSKEATFDLSDTMHDFNKNKLSSDSNLESRIRKLERDLTSSVQSTQYKKQKHESYSISSLDSFSIDANYNYKSMGEANRSEVNRSQLQTDYYNKRLNDLKSHDSKFTDPPVDWKHLRKMDNFEYQIQSLQDELEQLKDDIDTQSSKDKENRYKLKQKLHNNSFKKSDVDVQATHKQKNKHKYIPEVDSDEENRADNEQQDHYPLEQLRMQTNSHYSNNVVQSRIQEINVVDQTHDQKQVKNVNHDIQQQTQLSTIDQISTNNQQHQFDQAMKPPLNKSEVSIDLIPQKQTKLQILTKTDLQVPNSKGTIDLTIHPLKKLDKEIDVLKQIERIRVRLKKSIHRKISKEKIIETYDPSFNMPSKTRIVNKSMKQHCPNCAYLLNKGMSTAFCSCS